MESNIANSKHMKFILEATQKMVKISGSKKNEITHLEDDIANNERNFENIKDLANGIKESIHKNVVAIENRNNFVKIIEEYKSAFLPSAKNIHTLLLNLGEEINSANNATNELDEIMNENDQKYQSEIENYNKVEQELTTKLDKIKQTNFEVTKNKETLFEENIALKFEIENLQKEFNLSENDSTDIVNLKELNDGFRQEIILLSEECKKSEDEVLVTVKSFETIKLQNEEIYTNILTNMNSCDEKNSKLQETLESKKEELKHLVDKEKSLEQEFVVLKDCIEKSNKDLIDVTNKSEEVNKNKTIETQERFDKEMLCQTKTLTKIEELIRRQNELNSKLTEKIETLKTDSETLSSDVNVLKSVIPERQDLKESETKQEKFNELNLEFEREKENYELSVITEKDRLQSALKIIENENTKMKEYIAKLEKETDEIIQKEVSLQEEYASNEKHLMGLQRQISYKRAATVQPETETKRLRNWNSESDIVEEEVWSP